MNKQLTCIIKYLPLAFMVHNIEEAIAVGNTTNPIFKAHIDNINQFIIAVLLFTILGFIVVYGKKLYKNQRYYEYAVTGFSGMLFLNAFFPHILSSVYFRTYTPGLITVVVLILPITSIILWKTYQMKIFSAKQFPIAIISGGIVGILLVAVFLGIGYLFS